MQGLRPDAAGPFEAERGGMGSRWMEHGWESFAVWPPGFDGRSSTRCWKCLTQNLLTSGR